MSYKGERKVLGYDGNLFREGSELVRQARKELDRIITNEEEFRLVLEAVTKAIIGTRKASEAIHHPATSHLENNEIVNRTKTLGSPSDFQTDSEGLEILERFMNSDFIMLPSGYETSMSNY